MTVIFLVSSLRTVYCHRIPNAHSSGCFMVFLVSEREHVLVSLVGWSPRQPLKPPPRSEQLTDRNAWVLQQLSWGRRSRALVSEKHAWKRMKIPTISLLSLIRSENGDGTSEYRAEFENLVSECVSNLLAAFEVFVEWSGTGRLIYN